MNVRKYFLSGWLIPVIILLFHTSLWAIPIAKPDRIWIRLDAALYQSLSKADLDVIPYPTGDKQLDDAMRRYGVTQLEPVFRHHETALSDPIFLKLGMERDYRFIGSKISNAIDPEQLATELKSLPAIEDAAPFYFREICFQPNDWALSSRNSWGLDSCHARQAWDTQRGDSTLLALTIDTGVNYNHPDLYPNIAVNPLEDINHDGRYTAADIDGIDNDGNGYIDDVIGYNFVSYIPMTGDTIATGEILGPRNGNPVDVNGHGTHVCGILAARTNNGVGVASVSFNIKTICVKASFAYISGGALRGGGFDDDFIAAIQYAIDRGARIISISTGGSSTTALYQTAVTYARSHNCLVFAAAGNSNNSTRVYPAALDSVVAVANLGTGNIRSSSSSYGTWVDLAAPGNGIWSTQANNSYHAADYATMSGTSMASPMAAAVGALTLSRRPTMSADTLLALLKRTSTNVDAINPTYAGRLGSGLVNADSSVRSVIATPLLVTYPNGGEAWQSNFTREIYWSTQTGVANVAIEIDRNYPSGIWETIAASTPNSGRYTWLVTTPITASARIRILNVANPAIGDTSNANFSISLPALISVSPNPLSATLFAGDTLRQTVTLTNTGGATLSATLPDTGWTYLYQTSNDAGGPVFDWIDPTSGAAGPTGDDVLSGPYSLPFTFPFYGHSYTQAWFSTNGWLAFDNYGGSAYANASLPSTTFNTLIAPYWDDLNVIGSGATYIVTDNITPRMIFGWSNVKSVADSGSSLTFETVLYPDGSILFQYRTMSILSLPSATVGLQNASRTKYLNVVNNTAVSSNFAILFTPSAPFAKWYSQSFSLAPGNSSNIAFTWDARTFSPGTLLTGTLTFTGNAGNAPFNVPLTLNVVSRYPPALPSALSISLPAVTSDTVRLSWNGVHVDSAGNPLLVPVSYRIERQLVDSLTYTNSNWNTLTTLSDTTYTTTAPATPFTCYRVRSGIVISASDALDAPPHPIHYRWGLLEDGRIDPLPSRK